MSEPYFPRPDGRFNIEFNRYVTKGTFRGVRPGDTFTYNGDRFVVGPDIDSVYDGHLTYIARGNRVQL